MKSSSLLVAAPIMALLARCTSSTDSSPQLTDGTTTADHANARLGPRSTHALTHLFSSADDARRSTMATLQERWPLDLYFKSRPVTTPTQCKEVVEYEQANDDPAALDDETAPVVATSLTVAKVEPDPPAPSAPSIDPHKGILRLPAWSADRRIWIDGKMVGEGAEPKTVDCGYRLVRIGSSGTEKVVIVPCGGEVDLSH